MAQKHKENGIISSKYTEDYLNPIPLFTPLTNKWWRGLRSIRESFIAKYGRGNVPKTQLEKYIRMVRMYNERQKMEADMANYGCCKCLTRFKTFDKTPEDYENWRRKSIFRLTGLCDECAIEINGTL